MFMKILSTGIFLVLTGSIIGWVLVNAMGGALP